MFYQRDLDLLQKTFTKCGISLKVTELSNFVDFADVSKNTYYKLTDVLGLQYIFFLLPEAKEPTLLLIGPFESNDITAENSALMTLLDIFCQTIWGDKSAYETVIIDGQIKGSYNSLNWEKEDDEDYIFSYKMRQMESRYSSENELLEAVTLGHSHKADTFFPNTNKSPFDDRLKDSLRNTQNHLIIMNTLCRKAAEKGGVHPLYLHRLSSAYAKKIEKFTNIHDVQSFMREMFKAYCKLVKNHNTKDYSSLVEDVILYIESNLSNDLNLNVLAKFGNVNPSYLSTLFKKETGYTLVDFITRKRVALAKQLLETTNLQIQSVAHDCGIADVQYFSKVFKKYEGKSPSKYKAEL